METNRSVLHTSNLGFQYSGGTAFHFPDLECAPGQELLILGQSGKGKTTLLHLIGGLLRPTHGVIQLAGQDTTKLSDRQMDLHRGKEVGIVFQTAHFVDAMSVLDNLLMPAFLTGQKLDRDRAEMLLKQLNLSSKAHRKPSELSVGEQQRVAIARAVIHTPALLLADEPTSALDDHNAEQVIHLLKEYAAQHQSGLIIVTHDQRLKNEFQRTVVL
jgi:putative ABC transport system ATP-binding protein